MLMSNFKKSYCQFTAQILNLSVFYKFSYSFCLLLSTLISVFEISIKFCAFEPSCLHFLNKNLCFSYEHFLQTSNAYAKK
jgi:hypothetical protein